MCGIAGFYSLDTVQSRSELHMIGQKMAEALSHRGPDSSGIWQDPDVPLVLSHRRLAILDLSEHGHQPMTSNSDRYVLNYNGEIYNYLELQKTLSDADIQFQGRCDTEVILAAIEHWGLNETLQKLNGMFAFALWDRKERALHFVRDRLGKKPLYIGWAGNNLVFASELKALHQHPNFNPEISREHLALFMRYGYLTAPHCIYEDVWTLPAGHRLSLDLSGLDKKENLQSKMQPYWHHAEELESARQNPIQKSDEEITQEFETLLAQCVQDRLVSDVPLGAFLSGGIDSSTIVALMQQQASQPVKTYTIGFQEEGFDEAAHAKNIAAHLGTDHHELYLSGQEALETIPLLPQIYDEPFADISAIPTYLVSKFARESVTVALSGDGGDEMLGGYNRHVMGPKIWNRVRSMPRFLRQFISGAVTALPTNRWDALARAKPQFGTHMHKAASILSLDTQEEIYQKLLQQWPAPPVVQASHALDFFAGAEWHPQNLSFAEMMMYRDALSYLPNDILVKVDRASMAVGLEARAPLLDKRIYDYVWRLPENIKIRDGQGKYLLRQVLARHVPPALFERPKQGFNMPVGEWLRGSLKDWAAALLDESRLAQEGYLNAAAIQTCWAAHQNSHGNHAGRLWTVLMFQAWLEQWEK